MEDNTAGFVMMRAVLWANGEIFMQVCICIYVNFSFLLLFGGSWSPVVSLARAEQYVSMSFCMCVYGLFSVAKWSLSWSTPQSTITSSVPHKPHTIQTPILHNPIHPCWWLQLHYSTVASSSCFITTLPLFLHTHVWLGSDLSFSQASLVHLKMLGRFR